MRTSAPVTTCVICRARNQQISRLVNSGIRERTEPFDILRSIHAQGLAITDVRGNAITTPNKWSSAIQYHITDCLSADVSAYESGWKKRKSDDRIAIELRTAVESHGLAHNPEVITLAATHPGISDRMRDIMSGGDPLTKAEIIKMFNHYLPSIMVQHLAIVHQRQADYIDGYTVDAPVNDITSVEKCLKMLKELVGTYGVEDALN